MSDKNFGVRRIELISSSGTPNITSPNNLNLNANTVAISTDVSIGGQVTSNLNIAIGQSVGVGSTQPVAPLDVKGTIHADYFDIDYYNVTGILTAANLDIGISTFSGITTFYGQVHALDGVGINTISPTGDLDVNGHTELDTLNVSGIATFLSNIDANGSIDVSGHTELDNLNVSGVSTFSGQLNAGTISADFAVFSGDVSIAGTITYDDVTNIDSVGVITARRGIEVTSNGIDAVGVVTATSFDGPLVGNVTGEVNSTAFDTNNDGIVVTGVATATGFSGPLVGNVTGNVSGNVTGDLTGEVNSVSFDTNNDGIVVTGVVTATTASFTGTGAVGLTTGTTAQRPASPDAGMIRYNSENQQFEGYSTAWGGFGGASGSSGNAVFYENDTNVTDNYTITTGKNAMSAGPITLDAGVVVTIPSGSVWTVV